jgi:hypothetical protein
LASTGILLIVLSVLIAIIGDVRQRQQTTNSQQTFQKTAQTTLGCTDYDTLLSTNYNQQLELGYATLSQITTRVPGQNQALLNYEYNAIASEAYSLYTGSLSASSCTPSEAQPTLITPASPPDYTFDPTKLDPNIPLSCNITVATQYIDTFAKQYIRNMQNEQTSLTNFVSSFQPAPTSMNLRLTQGSTSVQAGFNNTSKNLVQVFSVDVGNVGC